MQCFTDPPPSHSAPTQWGHGGPGQSSPMPRPRSRSDRFVLHTDSVATRYISARGTICLPVKRPPRPVVALEFGERQFVRGERCVIGRCLVMENDAGCEIRDTRYEMVSRFPPTRDWRLDVSFRRESTHCPANHPEGRMACSGILPCNAVS